jgi:flagellar hook-associated protein 2
MATSISSTTTTANSSASTTTTAQVNALNKANAQKIITSLGAGSGVDVSSLAQNLVDAERIPRENAINAKIAKNDARVSGISAISYTFGQVQTAFQALNDQTDFTGASANVSDSTVLDAVAGANSTAGSHDLVVTQLAKAQRVISGGFADADTTTLSTTDFNLSISVHGGNAVSVPVTAAQSTPQGIVRAINGAATGVTAQLVNSGDGSANPYKILLSSSTGTSSDFNVTGGPTVSQTVNGVTSDVANLGLDFANPLQTAADAKFTLDGIAYTRTSNVVSDALPGVTLTLKSLNTSANPKTNIYLNVDTSAVKTNVQALVQAYNDAMSMLKVVSDPKSTVDTYGATLVNDSLVSSMKSQLRELFMIDSSTPGAKIKSLRDLGISIDMTGSMTLDNTKLDSALQNNFSDVVTMMTGNMTGLGQDSTAPAGVAGEANRKLSKLLGASGALKTATTTTTTQTTNYKEDLTKLQARMDSLLIRYQKQFATMDSMVGQATSTKASLKSTFANMNGTNNNN